MGFLSEYSMVELICVAGAVFMLGMSKGGFPVGVVAIPLLVLIWPGENEPGKTAVAFMLPVLCLMDLIAIIFYRKHILWKKLVRLMPATILGVIAGSFLFVAKEGAFLSVPDWILKLLIGVIGVLFVIYKASQKWVLKHMTEAGNPSWCLASTFGIFSGLSSTLAHAASPVMQMYLLPQKLDKMAFAGTTAAYFWMLNLVKMVPFAMLGRIESGNLMLGVALLPLIPTGVAFGFWLVKTMKDKHYISFIYVVLTITSVTLIIKSLQ